MATTRPAIRGKVWLEGVIDRHSFETPKQITAWWLNHPSEKYARQNGSIFPNFRGENKQYVKPPPSCSKDIPTKTHRFSPGIRWDRGTSNYPLMFGNTPKI